MRYSFHIKYCKYLSEMLSNSPALLYIKEISSPWLPNVCNSVAIGRETMTDTFKGQHSAIAFWFWRSDSSLFRQLWKALSLSLGWRFSSYVSDACTSEQFFWSLQVLDKVFCTSSLHLCMILKRQFSCKKSLSTKFTKQYLSQISSIIFLDGEPSSYKDAQCCCHSEKASSWKINRTICW